MSRLNIERVDSTKSSKYLLTDEISDLVESYINRKKIEEAERIDKLGGENYLIGGLHTDTVSGIDSSSIPERIKRFGENKLEPRLAKGLWGHIKDACEDPLIKILIAVCIGMLFVNLFFNRSNFGSSMLDSVSIMIAVLLCVGVASMNNYQKDKQYLALYRVSQSNRNALVLRDGNLKNIQTTQIVVGDIVMIQEGMEIPADGWVIQSNDVRIDESSLTGENATIVKEKFENVLKSRESKSLANFNKGGIRLMNYPSCIVLAGSKVLSGNGKFIALQVGPHTAMGKINQIVLGDEDPTPLQDKLKAVAENIGKFGSLAAVGIVVILMAKSMYDNYRNPDFALGPFASELLNYVLIGLSTAVASIPEGLPLAVTIALAYSAKKMIKDKNLVRKIDACETMGGANCICSDKTGTLTQNKMQIKMVYVPDQASTALVEVADLSYDQVFPEKVNEIITLNCACNNASSLDPPSGSKTDQAFLQFFKVHKIDYQKIQEKYITEDTKKFSFSSNRKRSAIIIDIDGDTLLCKGAAEYMVAASEYVQDKDGSIKKLDEQRRSELNEVINSIFPCSNRLKLKPLICKEISEKALRPIGLAYKKIEFDADLQTKDEKGVYEIEKSDLILSAIIGIGDPLREGVKEAIAKCQRAQIKVRMITGDNLGTGREIAREAGILTPDGFAMEGVDFMQRIGGVVCKTCGTATCGCPRSKRDAKRLKKKLRVDTIGNAAEFDNIYPKLDVLARARPEDKYALVVGLKERGYVVAVTGDGANDAPALLKADVGFAMGESGTQIAQEASDIVIMDDNISSIVQAVVWGRNVYDNIRKFLQFQLTINVSAVTIIAIGAIVSSTPVFTPVQLLWINLVMDTLASLALAAEDPNEDVLNRPPHSRRDKIISNTMIKHICGQAIYQVAVLTVLIFAGDKFIPENLPDVTDANGKSIVYAPGGKYVRSGRLKYPFSFEDDYQTTYGPSRHFTVIFNTFVFMQVFGFFAARRIDDSWNIFKGVHKSGLFLSIVVLVAVIQTIFVQLGGVAVGSNPSGLSLVQWAICIAFGSGVLIVNFLLKLLPDPQLRIEFEHENESKMSEADNRSDFSADNGSPEKQPLLRSSEDLYHLTY